MESMGLIPHQLGLTKTQMMKLMKGLPIQNAQIPESRAISSSLKIMSEALIISSTEFTEPEAMNQ